MPNEPRLQSRDLVFSSQETTQRTLQEASPRSITISAMTANTLTSTQLTAAHVGCIVAAEDGAIRGNPARIKSVVSNVATLDRSFHTTLAAGAVFRVWIPPAVPFVADSGSTTSFVDATHATLTNEPDGTFNGDFALMRTGANAGGAFKINAFTTAAGTLDLTGDPTPNAVVAGDLCDVVTLARPETSTVTSDVTVNVIARRLQGSGDADQGVPTISAGTISMDFALKPISTAAASTIQAVPPYEMGRYLRDVMTETKDTGSTYTSQGGAAPTGIQVTVAAGAGFTVGGFALMSNGEASQIIDKPSANVLALPQLTAAAQVATSNVYASCWYQRKTSDFRTRTWFQYVGGLDLRMFMGCAPTIELDLARDAVIKFMMKYSATDALEYTTGNPNALAGHKFALSADTNVPVDGKAARIMIDSVPLLIGAVKITFGIKTLLRMSLSGMNQGDGYAFDCEPVMWSVSGYLADNNDIASNQKLTDRLRRGEVLSLFYQKGSNPKETFCAAAPAAQISKVSLKSNGGQYEFDFDATCILPQAARGNTANALLPAFAVGWC